MCIKIEVSFSPRLLLEKKKWRVRAAAEEKVK
jgi:hypothetical protein